MEEYGIYDWLRSINQKWFIHNATCRLAAPINLWLNTYTKIPFKKEEIEYFMQNEYVNSSWRISPLWKTWGNGIDWMKRFRQYLQKKYNTLPSIRLFKSFDKLFYKYLEEWRLIVVNINISDNLVKEFWKQDVTSPVLRPYISWHWIILGKDSKWYFFLNSSEPKTNKIRVRDIKLEWLIKTFADAFTFIPSNIGIKNI